MATFYEEIYKLKNELRKGWIHYGVTSEHQRYESDAEHTFSMCMLAYEIMEKENLKLDKEKVLEMILIHELGEIDCGDKIHIYDDPEKEKIFKKQKYDSELSCVKRIADQCDLKNIVSLWIEFERNETPEAKFVKDMDGLDAIKQSKIYSEIYNRPEIYYDDFYINNKEIADKYSKYL